MKAIIKFWIVLALGIFSSACQTTDRDGGFLFVTFRGEATPMTEQVYFMLSEDAKDWDALNGGEPALVSTVGERGVRDPYIFRKPDGSGFVLIATDLSINLNPDWDRAQTSASQSIVIWESADLVNWSEPRLAKVAAKDAGSTWAPEIVFDRESQSYMIFWASRTGRDGFAKHRIWATMTKDFRSFGEPFVYIEKPDTVIDTTVIQQGDSWYRFTKDEREKTITMEVSDHLLQGWRDVETFNLGDLRGYEGPTAFVGEYTEEGTPKRWNLLLDWYATGEGYQAYVTENLASGIFEKDTEMTFPFHPVRHGSVLALTAEEYERLKTEKAFPVTD